jgi:hypothetical protein
LPRIAKIRPKRDFTQKLQLFSTCSWEPWYKITPENSDKKDRKIFIKITQKFRPQKQKKHSK